MKIAIKTVALIFLFSFYVANPTEAKKERPNIKITNEDNAATQKAKELEKTLNDIKIEFYSINSKLNEFRKVFRSICSESEESGEDFTGYYDYDDNQLKKLVLQIYSMPSNHAIEFYFKNNQLIFIFDEYIEYKNAISSRLNKQKLKIERKDQNRYYIDDSIIILWLENNKKRANDQNDVLQKVLWKFKQYIKEYQKRYENPCDCMTEDCGDEKSE